MGSPNWLCWPPKHSNSKGSSMCYRRNLIENQVQVFWKVLAHVVPCNFVALVLSIPHVYFIQNMLSSCCMLLRNAVQSSQLGAKVVPCSELQCFHRANISAYRSSGLSTEKATFNVSCYHYPASKYQISLSLDWIVIGFQIAKISLSCWLLLKHHEMWAGHYRLSRCYSLCNKS